MRLILAVLFVGSFSIGSAIAQEHSHDDGHGHEQHDDHAGHNHDQHDDHAGHDHESHAGHDHESHAGHDHEEHAGHDAHGEGEHHAHSACDHHEEDYNLAESAISHIADANEFHILGHISIPLPVLIKETGQGFLGGFRFLGMSSIFEHGHTAVDGFVLNHGRVNRVVDPNFPMGEVHLSSNHVLTKSVEVDGEMKDVGFICYEGDEYALEAPSTIDGGLVGGGMTSFHDFSVTKNVFTMLLAALLLIWLWTGVARRYKKNEGKAPSGRQGFFEVFFVFIRDEVSIPMIGKDKYERFQPFIMTLFFFILFCNLMGLVPFFPGSANVTGNIAVTMVLAVLAFIVTNLNGNRHYWEHVFWMPGVPTFVKPILTIVEFLGLFIKPFSLMIRLFANISAGHIIILSLVGLIFFFGDSGASLSGGIIGVVVGGLFTAFMNLIELLVAFLQAFIFAILTASYIGAAVEDHHHEHDEDVAHAHAH